MSNQIRNHLYSLQAGAWFTVCGAESDMRLHQEAAESGEGGVAEIAPTVEIVRPALVRRLQVLEMGGIFAL